MQLSILHLRRRYHRRIVFVDARRLRRVFLRDVCARGDGCNTILTAWICPQKRSQRFTVPVQVQQQQQPAHASAAGSPPFSSSDRDSSASLSGGADSGVALSFQGSSNSYGMPTLGNGLSPAGQLEHQLQGNNAMSGSSNPGVIGTNNDTGGLATSPLGAVTLPSFLQQDPFAFANTGSAVNSSRQRTLSAGNNAAQSLPSWALQAAGLSNGVPASSGTFSPFGNLNGTTTSTYANGGVSGPAAAGPGGLQGIYSPPYGIPSDQMQLPAAHPQHQQPPLHQQQAVAASSSDDIIPTAIVIKNIPFAFPSTSLLQIIEELTLAPPYAFNYHFDNGTFRGLAFANFHTPQETDACVAALNGFEINGRKLRVEYKKVLQAGEKERIERDKAIKRMRSMQLERERLINHHQMHAHQLQSQQQHQQQHYAQFAQHHQSQQQPHLQQQQQASRDDDYEDYGKPISTSYASPAVSMPQQQQPQQLQHLQSQGLATPSSIGVSSTGTGSSTELDMNDPVTLEIYSRVLLFKDDALRDELAFSRALSPIQRRVVHLIAQRLGLEHRSVGTGEDRFVVIVKPPSSNGDAGGEHRSLRTKASAGGFGFPLAGGAGGLIGNGSLANRKKSMPDLRYQQSHPVSVVPPIGTMPQLSTANLASLANIGGARFGASGSSLPFLSGQLGMGAGGGISPVLPLPLTEDLHAAGPGSGSTSPSNGGVATRHSNHDLRRPRSAFYGAADFASVPPVPALPPQSATAASISSIGSAPGSAGIADHLMSGSNNAGNKAVGSPVGVTRQPKGPGDGQGSWARAAGAPPGL